jgi:triacylglycerol esterase/lipase EstA (alpha/beta hydrolase family)
MKLRIKNKTKNSKLHENPTTTNQLIKSNTKIEKSELSPNVGTVPFLVRKTKCVKKKEKKRNQVNKSFQTLQSSRAESRQQYLTQRKNRVHIIVPYIRNTPC